jgi:hypothetical protein
MFSQARFLILFKNLDLFETLELLECYKTLSSVGRIIASLTQIFEIMCMLYGSFPRGTSKPVRILTT